MSRIRMVASGIVRINLDGKVLLLLNKARLNAGKKVYVSIGGALKFYESARPFLTQLSAVFEKGNDIRLALEEERLPEFEKWFYAQKDREISPYREVREELVDEEKALKILPESGVTLEYMATVVERNITDRPGQEGRLTQRYFEINRATFSPAYEQELRAALAKPDSHLTLATEDEILAGRTNSGIKIVDKCHLLQKA